MMSNTFSVRFINKGSKLYIGTFSTPEIAAKEYYMAARARLRDHGIYIYNFPEIGERSAVTGEIRIE